MRKPFIISGRMSITRAEGFIRDSDALELNVATMDILGSLRDLFLLFSIPYDAYETILTFPCFLNACGGDWFIQCKVPHRSPNEIVFRDFAKNIVLSIVYNHNAGRLEFWPSGAGPHYAALRKLLKSMAEQ